MNQWTEKLMESVKEACSARPGILEAKEEAAEKIKPLMMAQAYSEVDKFQKLIKSLEQSGLLPEEEDPRHSDEVAKAGKMKMLKSGSASHTAGLDRPAPSGGPSPLTPATLWIRPLLACLAC